MKSEAFRFKCDYCGIVFAESHDRRCDCIAAILDLDGLFKLRELSEGCQWLSRDLRQCSA